MKVYHILLIITIGLISYSCSSDSELQLPELSAQKTFSANSLNMKYCGETMPAKEVTLSIEDTRSMNATLICNGITDLNQLSSIGLSGTGSAPGILPGSPLLNFETELFPGSNSYKFNGNGITDFCAYSYNGDVYSDSLKLSINDVILHNKDLAGIILKPVPFKQSGLTVETSPFHLVWEIDPAVGIDLDLTSILEAIVTLPLVPTYNGTAYSSLSQLLSSSLQTVAFNENGNIFVRYFSSVGGATQLMTSVGNTLQYVIPASGTLLLYPNPTTLFGRWLVAQSDSEGIPNISFTSAAPDSDGSSVKESLIGLLKIMLPDLLVMTEQGIPLSYQISDKSADIYLDTKTILTLLTSVLTKIANNPEILSGMLEYLSTIEINQEILANFKELLPKFQTILEHTTKIEVGLSFNR